MKTFSSQFVLLQLGEHYKGWQASHTIGRQTNILYIQLSMDCIQTCNIKNEENTMVFKSYIQHDLELFPGCLNTRVVFRVRAIVKQIQEF